jgi:hypothetical protein
VCGDRQREPAGWKRSEHDIQRHVASSRFLYRDRQRRSRRQRCRSDERDDTDTCADTDSDANPDANTYANANTDINCWTIDAEHQRIDIQQREFDPASDGE